MNPLFPAHLIADFLLQPSWLVRWKEKHVTGVVVHAAIHAICMALLVLPDRFSTVALIVLVAILHGWIDHLKIAYQKRRKEFVRPFLMDQLAHFAVLVGATMASPVPLHWNSLSFQWIAGILLFYSFAIGCWHLTHSARLKTQPLKKKFTAMALLFAVFLSFMAGGKLLATTACSWL